MIEAKDKRPFVPVGIAVLTVSDTRTSPTTVPATRWLPVSPMPATPA
jgi:hypothetical protein